jgi:hypothetical protein
VRWWVNALLVACSVPAPRAATPARACERVVARGDAIDDAEARALVRRRCTSCHVAPQPAAIGEMVGTCQMPPDEPSLSLDARRLLVEWSAAQPR